MTAFPEQKKPARPVFRAAALLCGCLILASFPGLVSAQLTELRLPISLDADSTDYDGKNSMLTFKNLKLSQGNIGIEADEGRASKLDFEDSVWRFTGNVVIDVENGHIECDSADLQFSEHALIIADIRGAPATFELTRAGGDDVTYAEAGKLRYDLRAGTIEFSENATITEGGNQISSSFLVYNIAEQRINASADGEDRVKIIYTPRDDESEEQPADDSGDDQPEEQPEDPAEDEPGDDGS